MAMVKSSLALAEKQLALAIEQGDIQAVSEWAHDVGLYTATLIENNEPTY
jgi:hypothetical protein